MASCHAVSMSARNVKVSDPNLYLDLWTIKDVSVTTSVSAIFKSWVFSRTSGPADAHERRTGTSVRT